MPTSTLAHAHDEDENDKNIVRIKFIIALKDCSVPQIIPHEMLNTLAPNSPFAQFLYDDVTTSDSQSKFRSNTSSQSTATVSASTRRTTGQRTRRVHLVV